MLSCSAGHIEGVYTFANSFCKRFPLMPAMMALSNQIAPSPYVVDERIYVCWDTCCVQLIEVSPAACERVGLVRLGRLM